MFVNIVQLMGLKDFSVLFSFWWFFNVCNTFYFWLLQLEANSSNISCIFISISHTGIIMHYSYGSLSWIVLLLHPSFFVILSLFCSLSVRLTRIARTQIKSTIASITSNVRQKIVKLWTAQGMFIKWRNTTTNWQCFSCLLHDGTYCKNMQEIDFPQCWFPTMAFWANCSICLPFIGLPSNSN